MPTTENGQEENVSLPCSLRDWFAGQALTGPILLQSWIRVDGISDAPFNAEHTDWAEQAYELADAMLAQRDKKDDVGMYVAEIKDSETQGETVVVEPARFRPKGG